MRTARVQEARSIQAQGQRQAQIVRAEADAEATATYARAFNQDADFYDFYRAMQSYETSFTAAGTAENPRGRTNIILSPENDYLRQFRAIAEAGDKAAPFNQRSGAAPSLRQMYRSDRGLEKGPAEADEGDRSVRYVYGITAAVLIGGAAATLTLNPSARRRRRTIRR